MTVQQSPQSFAFNVAPVMKMYLDSVEAWKKSYGNLAINAKDNLVPSSAGDAKTALDCGLATWHKSGEVLFTRFVEQQIEICRFFANRWEQYLKLPAQLAQCHSPADIGQLQTAFLSQFANDYMHEAGKLVQPAGELMSNLVSHQSTS